jgi:enoyl-CoA hydratase/carnithine racemase
MAEEAVDFSIENGIATITLDRPESRNALSEAVVSGIVAALSDIEAAPVGEADSPRCVVIEGSGGAFCAGGDINAMTERAETNVPLPEAERRVAHGTSAAIARVAECPVPTVAKIDGPAFGAGANLAIACDVLLASPDARIGFGFRQVGLTVDTGTSYLLPRLVGLNTAKELVLTGELLDADRASDLGLFNHVYPNEFDERADALIDDIATGPTVALRKSKRLLNSGLETTLDQAIANEAAAQTAVFETHDHEEGVRAFGDRRDPEFEGR